jgi:hypothetical protein
VIEKLSTKILRISSWMTKLESGGLIRTSKKTAKNVWDSAKELNKWRKNKLRGIFSVDAFAKDIFPLLKGNSNGSPEEVRESTTKRGAITFSLEIKDIRVSHNSIHWGSPKRRFGIMFTSTYSWFLVYTGSMQFYP